MRRIIKLDKKPYFLSHAAVGGYEERRGPLGDAFDLCDDTDLFGMKSWESAESEMGRLALNLALHKASLSEEVLDVILAGDLQNQCVASSGGLYTFGVPYIGLYSACSTCTEGYVSGVGSKIFTVAGPVILFAGISGTLYGFVYFLVNLFAK